MNEQKNIPTETAVPAQGGKTSAATKPVRGESLLSRFLSFCQRHKVLSMIFAIAIVLEIVFGGGPGVKGIWNLGVRTVGVENLQYSLTPDRKELVIRYDIETVRTIVGPLKLESRPAETRIPLDPMPGSVRKITVEVVTDPAVRPAFNDYLGTYGNRDENTKMLPCMGYLLQETGPASGPGIELWKPDSPDSNCRLAIHPHDVPLLDESFCCMSTRCLLIPYGRDGGRRVMLRLSYVDDPHPYSNAPFLREILGEHPEAMKGGRDNNLLLWCMRIMLLPFGLLFDMVFVSIACLYMLGIMIFLSRSSV
ncbi:MAG: hypothetical protein J6Y92_09370 [Lentisphaeria bacterium]|nr:hypothetical protein [Lentisphaeria bacterium]